MRKIESRFLKVYFIILIIYAIFGLLDSIVFSGSKENFGQMGVMYNILIAMFIFSVFILSIVALIIFAVKKYPKVIIFMPIYQIAAKIIIFGGGIVWGIILFIKGADIVGQPIPSIVVIIGVLTSLFELIYCSYVLYKYTNISQKF